MGFAEKSAPGGAFAFRRQASPRGHLSQTSRTSAIERLRGLTGNDLEVPRLAPDVAVEVLSSGDRRADVDDKIATYLAAGTALVIIVDPKTHTVEPHDPGGHGILSAGQSLAHSAIPGFSLSVAELFEIIAPPR